MKKVNVIYKTHLDLGFTNLAASIMDKYFNEFIIKAIELANKVNNDTRKDFIWTTGSWLIYHFLENANKEHKDMMERAIKKGYIVWHALPFTTHSELMDKDLLEYGISLSEELDRRYNKKTIAAKLTDVPGHTKAMIDILAQHGIKFLHIGVNPASAVPEVPQIFLWRSDNNNEIVVNYEGDYGHAYKNDELEEVLCFAHTSDNMGPLSEIELYAQIDELKHRYEGYEVCASTLNDFAEKIWSVKRDLPVLTCEIGDSWIHGVGSDPLKVGQYRELLGLKNKWLKQGSLSRDSMEYRNFCDYLLRIPEHTWGMDEKTYLPDFKNYLKKDFKAARNKDLINILDNPEEYLKRCIFSLHHDNESSYVGPSYSCFEASWLEQREYIYNAINSTQGKHKEEALDLIESLVPSKDISRENYEQIDCNKSISVGNFRVTFDTEGTLISLIASDATELITKGKRFGVIEYQILNVKDYIFWFDNYIRDFEITKEWSQLDFSKAGIERYEKVIEDGRYAYKFKSLFLKREDNYDSILVEYNINEVLSNDYGAPRIVQVKYCFHKEFNAFDYEINWFNKDANRMPEAIWVNFNLNLKDIDSWRMKKINSYLHLTDIAINGNRNLSAVEELKYEKDGKQLIIRNIHAPLFSMGKGKILQFDNKFEELNDGISFNLYNNVWGTNFPMWYEDDARFVFRFEYSNNSTEN